MASQIRDYFIEILKACNLACEHCYLKHHIVRKCKQLYQPREWISEKIQEAKSLGAEHVILTGGETSLYPEVFKIIKEIRDAGMKPIMISNSSFIPLIADELEQSGLFALNISVDYPDERHDNFRKYPGLIIRVRKTLEAVKDKSFKKNLLVTLFKHDFNDYIKILELAEAYNAHVLFGRFVPYSEVARYNPKEYKELLKQLHELKGRSVAVYEPLYYCLYPEEGEPRFRCKERLFASEDGYAICPLYPEFHPTAKEALNVREAEELSPECKGCKFEASCHAGCPATRARFDKSKKDVMCFLK